MKTVSKYQIIARVLITVMLAGVLVLLAGYCVVAVQKLISPSSGDELSAAVSGISAYVQPFSFLLELFGLVIWSIFLNFIPAFQLDLDIYHTVFIDLGDNDNVTVQDTWSFVILIALLIAILIVLLLLSCHLTKTKGARTACAVFLALIIVDLPMCPMAYAVAISDFWNSAGVFISLTLHLAAAVMLIFSLRHIAQSREAYSDFTRPKDAKLTVSARGTVDENTLTRASEDADRNRSGAAIAARVLTIILSLFTLVNLLSDFIPFILETDRLQITADSSVFWTIAVNCSHLLYVFYSGFFTNFKAINDVPVDSCFMWFKIMALITTLVMPVAVLWAQRYFTKNRWLARPMLVMALTIAVINSMPLLSPLFIFIPNTALHGLLIGTLISSIRKTE